ncbi:MAG: hypothetical protein QW367_01070 [Candidatus Aenigmatarchaeota archaeon]
MKNKEFKTTEQKRKAIREKALEILENSPQGIRYSKLVNKIHEEYPEIKLKLIQWEIWNLDKKIKDVIKPERGLYILRKFYENLKEEKIFEEETKIREETIYQKFADYLVQELEECTKAIPLGGSVFRDRWGTPDVLGIYKISKPSIIEPLPEIISAEIKIDTNQPIIAFGQACSYKLFSHKVYLVLPETISQVDLSRLESLCLRFGIGLILFNVNQVLKEDAGLDKTFRIITRAIKQEPDYFYVNEYLKRLDRNILEKLII